MRIPLVVFLNRRLHRMDVTPKSTIQLLLLFVQTFMIAVFLSDHLLNLIHFGSGESRINAESIMAAA